MAETKSRILYILKYLWHNTDAEHYGTTGDILTYLKENGISCDRKTIPATLRSSVILVLILKKKEAVRTAIP